MVCDLEAARITSLPADAFYISDFISEDEEAWLLQKVSAALDISDSAMNLMQSHDGPSLFILLSCLLFEPTFLFIHADGFDR